MTMTLIFNNIYIFLFFSLIIIYIILRITLKGIQLKVDASPLIFARYLNTLKNHNIKFSVFILIIYLSIVISPLLILRINRLGLVSDLPTLGDNALDYKLYIPIIFAILSFVLVLQIANFVLYIYVLKLHFYLYYKSTYYNDTFTEYAFFKDDLLRKYVFVVFKFIYFLLQTNKNFIKNYKRGPTSYDNVAYEWERRKRKWLCYLFLRSYVHKSVILTQLLNHLLHIVSKIEFYISRFMYYFPYSLLCITLGYDITQGVIAYTFYATLYLYITNIIKKIRKFYLEKDQVLDHVLGEYFYKDLQVYNDFNYSLKQNDLFNLSIYSFKYPEIRDVFNNQEEYINYINSDFMVEFIRRPARTQGTKIILNTCKRQNIFMVLIIFNMYLLYYNKYILVANNISINITFISIIILGVLYYLHRQIPEETEDSWIEHKNPKRIFYLILIILILALSLLFLKNKLTLNPQEIIISFQDIITIRENFTLTDKYNFFKKYITHLKVDSSLDNNILEKIQKDIIEHNLIKFEMTFKEIKELIANLYMQENIPLEIIKKETLIEKLYKFIGYKK